MVATNIKINLQHKVMSSSRCKDDTWMNKHTAYEKTAGIHDHMDVESNQGNQKIFPKVTRKLGETCFRWSRLD